MLEIENYDAVKTIINRDYETFSHKMLERYFKRVLIESKAYTRIGSWWNRKGENEIDIVAENELNDEAVFIEVKRKEKNFDAIALNEKVDVFTRATGMFKDYTVSQKALSMTDMKRIWKSLTCCIYPLVPSFANGWKITTTKRNVVGW